MIAVAFILALAVQDSSRPPTFDPEALRLVDSIAIAEFQKDSLGSITIGVVSGASLVWTKSYGFVDKARTRPASSATVYRVASITKQATALMLLQLVERGRVHLSDPVNLYFPEIRRVTGLPPRASPPTLLQLATMTSGLARDPDDKRRSQSGALNEWEGVLVASLARTKYVRAPGSGYGYSNVGYSILGAALARAARIRYVEYQRRHLLRPLGMSSTDFELTPALRSRLAVGVDWDELYKDTLNFEDAAREHESGIGFRVPGGGLYSTVEDLAKLVSLQLGYGPDSVVSRATLKLRDGLPVTSNLGLGYGYGLGVQVLRWGDTVAIGHSGNLAGYTSMVLYDPGEKYGVIVLRSAAGGEADAGRLAGRAFRKLRSRLVH